PCLDGPARRDSSMAARLSLYGSGPATVCRRRVGAVPNVRAMAEAERTYLQENQPDGVPPLALTCRRTVPDAPEENDWYRRRVAVYAWIANRCVGLRVVDLASGEGYGSDLLAGRAAEVTGVDANPEAFQHAAARYRRPNLTFQRGLVE